MDGPAAKAHILPQPELERDAVQTGLTDELRAQARHFPLGQLRLVPVEEVRRDEAEDGVTEELKALIALRAAVALVRVGAVRQRREEKIFVFEGIAYPFFKLFHYACSPLIFIYSILSLMSPIRPESTKATA